ncbi:MAG TPA: M48 family metalloprotease, partial [Gemmatimonadota bacterium]|nr:M48 family metalloprotease [Gemmatimonadota bacterium]
ILAMILGGLFFGFSESALWTVVAISLIAALVLVVATIVLVYRRSTRLMLRVAGARLLPRDHEPRLRRTVENLCIGAGLRPPRLYVIESKATNLCSTGLDRNNASLVVTRGSLELLEPRELEGAVAQELSQIGNEDIRPATVVGALTTILWWPLLFVRLVPRLGRALGRLAAGPTSTARWMAIGVASLALLPFLLPLLLMLTTFALLPLLVLLMAPQGIAMGLQVMDADPTSGWMILATTIFTVYVLDGAPIIGFLIRRRLGHRQEFRADADALVLTRHPSGLARALATMTAGANAELSVNSTISPLFLVDPLARGLRSRLLSTHPPVDERIDALVAMGMVDPREIDEARAQGLGYHERWKRSGPSREVPGGGPQVTEAKPPVVSPPTEEVKVPDPTPPGSLEVEPRPPTFCGLVRDSTTDYLDGSVDSSLASEIRAHIGSCPPCDDYVTRRIFERMTSGRPTGAESQPRDR